GTKGRIEMFDLHGSHLIAGQTDEELAAMQRHSGAIVPGIGNFVVYFPMFGRPVELEVPVAEGGHGGGDKLILEQLFLPDPPHDPYNRKADHIDGVASILLGIAANRSIETGQPVEVDDLVDLSQARQQEAGVPA